MKNYIILLVALLSAACASTVHKLSETALTSKPEEIELHHSETYEEIESFAKSFYNEDIPVQKADKTVKKLLKKHPENAILHEIAGFVEKLKGNREAVFSHFLHAAADLSSSQTDLHLRILDTETPYSMPALKARKKLLEKLRKRHPSPRVRTLATQFLISDLLRFAELDKASQLVSEIGYVDEIKLLGVFDNSDGKGFYKEFPPEKESFISDSYSGKITDISWKKVEHFNSDGTITLNKITAPSSHSTAYFLTWVYAPEKMESHFQISTGGPMKLWVNNIEHYRHKHLEYFSFNNVSIPVELQKGWNRVLIKTTNKVGSWKFGMFITDSRGDEISGISFSTEKKASIPEMEKTSLTNKEERSVMPEEGRELFLSHIKTLLSGNNYNAKEKIIKYRDKTKNTLSLFYAAETYNRAHLEGTYINTVNRAIKKTGGKLSSFITKKASYEMKKNLLDEGEATIRNALKVNPENFEAHRKLLSLFEIRDWPVEQHRILEKMHKMYPGDLSILRLLAYNYEYRDYYKKAVSFFRLMEKLIPGEISVLNYLYRYHKNLQEHKKAAEYMDLIIRMDPDNPSHYLEKGTLFREMKKPEKAFELFRKSSEINQQWHLPLLKTAELHHEMGRDNKALEYWQKAFHLNPENSRIAERIDYMTKKDSKDTAKDFVPDHNIIKQKIEESSKIKIDDNANVLMIYDHAVTILNPDGSSRWEITTVKKALNEEGRDHLIHNYLPYSGRIKVKNAYAISPDGSRIEASSIRGSEIRFRKLKPGDITVIQYTHYKPSLSFLRNSFTASWYVQGSYYHTFLSEWKLFFEEQTLNLANRSESIKISDSKSGKYKVKTFTAKDVPPLPREPYSPPLDNFIEKIVVSTISSWEDFTSWERALLNDAFMTNNSIKKLTEKLTSDAENKYEVIDNIFHFVAQEIRYQQDYATYIAGVKPHSAPRVLERGYGDCKDKSVLFIQLAAEAGIDVNYALIRTTTSGKILKEIPNQQFNHAIVYIPEQEGIEKGFFMDPTVDLLEKGNLRRDNQGATALVLDWKTGDFHFKKVPYQKAELNFQKINALYTISENNTVSISGVFTTRGRISSSLRRAFRTEGRGRKIFESMISRIFKGATLESYETSDIEDITTPLKIGFKADASHLATKLDNEYHYRIPHRILSGKTINLRERTLPLELGIHSMYHINTEIIIPEDFSISRMPGSYKTKHSCMDISRKVSFKNNRITILEGYKQTCSKVDTEDYPSFRKTVQEVLSHTGDKLILKKE